MGFGGGATLGGGATTFGGGGAMGFGGGATLGGGGATLGGGGGAIFGGGGGAALGGATFGPGVIPSRFSGTCASEAQGQRAKRKKIDTKKTIHFAAVFIVLAPFVTFFGFPLV